MAERYVVSVSKTLHEKVGAEVDRLNMSRKEYVQGALVFFTTRKINPVTYDPGKEFDLVQTVKKSTEKVLAKLEQRENNIPKELVEEVVRGRLLQEAQLNLLIEKLIEPELRERVQKDIISYIEDTLHQSTDK